MTDLTNYNFPNYSDCIGDWRLLDVEKGETSLPGDEVWNFHFEKWFPIDEHVRKHEENRLGPKFSSRLSIIRRPVFRLGDRQVVKYESKDGKIFDTYEESVNNDNENTFKENVIEFCITLEENISIDMMDWSWSKMSKLLIDKFPGINKIDYINDK